MIGSAKVGAVIANRPPAAPPAELENRKSEISAGFTLLEILLVLALIALLAGLLVGGTTAMISQKNPSMDDLFWKVAFQARKIALESGHDVHLRFEPREKTLILEDGGTPRTFPLPSTAGPDASVDFLSMQKTGGAMLLGGTVVETQPMPTGVTFYEDGTCTPFRVQIRANGGAHILAIDPWTCAAILPANDPLNPP